MADFTGSSVADPAHAEWHRVVALLELAAKEGHLDVLLHLLTTPDEREALGIRLRIIEALLQGDISQRELKQDLGVGIATITRGSNSLKNASPALLTWLERELLAASE
ncbi:MAG: Trp operon repressor [Candidatus Erwinia impunctatus]|nr:Trp operon repressor [Culicoides impunctatus]